MARQTYQHDDVKASGPYSHAVDDGDYLFLSGQTARNRQDQMATAMDIQTQTEACFQTLSALLQKAGLELADVVKVNVYLTRMADFAAMNAVYEQHFSAPFPTRTCVAVKELPLGADVEIEMVAKHRR